MIGCVGLQVPRRQQAAVDLVRVGGDRLLQRLQVVLEIRKLALRDGLLQMRVREQPGFVGARQGFLAS